MLALHEFVDVASRMTCRKYHIFSPKRVALLGAYATNMVAIDEKFGYFAIEMHFAAIVNNRLTHIFDDDGQSVGADVWMRFVENGILRAMIVKNLKNALRIAAFVAACV